jgi:hypothetical protein
VSQPIPFAMRYTDAVWESQCLTTDQAFAAIVYADHAKGGDTAWVTTSRLMQRTKIRSRTTACAVVAALVKAGWLERLGPHPQHQQRIVYRLTIPSEERQAVKPAANRARTSGGRFATSPSDGPVEQAGRPVENHGTGPCHGPQPVHTTDRSMAATGPRRGAQPVHGVVETGPQHGTDSFDSLKDSSSSARRLLPADLGATAEEEEIIIRRITTANPRIGHLGRYVAAMHANGDLAPLLAQIRAEQHAAEVEAARVAARLAARGKPVCEHGIAGGAVVVNPVTGRLLCPLPHTPARPEPCAVDEDPAPAADRAARVPLPPPTAATVRATARVPAPGATIRVTPVPVGHCPRHPLNPGGHRPDGVPHCAPCRFELRAGAGRSDARPAEGRHRTGDPDPAPAGDHPDPAVTSPGVVDLADYRTRRPA